MVYVRILTIDDLEFDNKTVFLRVDMNCPIDSQTLEISGTKRIEEIVDTLNSLKNAKIVIASIRVGLETKTILVWLNMPKYLKNY